MNEAWERLNSLALKRKERLFGAHEIQCYQRDADETLIWISEKKTTLSTEDHGRDLASVQALQRKHEGITRDLLALKEKVCYTSRFPSVLVEIQIKFNLLFSDSLKLKISQF